MKIIILFALASVSVCTEKCSTCEPYVPTFDRCDGIVNKYANDDNCLEHALESSQQLLEIAKKMICKHRRNELDKAFIYYAEFEKELRDFMGCTACFVGEIIGVEEILGHIGASLGSVLGLPVEITGQLIHSTGVLDPVLDFTCGLLTGELTSKCVALLSNSDLKSKAGSLKNMSCMAKKATMDVPLTVEILRTAGCIGGNLLGLEDTLAHLTGGIAQTLDSLLKPLLHAVMGIPGVGDIVAGIVCTALGLVVGLLGGVLGAIG